MAEVGGADVNYSAGEAMIPQGSQKLAGVSKRSVDHRKIGIKCVPTPAGVADALCDPCRGRNNHRIVSGGLWRVAPATHRLPSAIPAGSKPFLGSLSFLIILGIALCLSRSAFAAETNTDTALRQIQTQLIDAPLLRGRFEQTKTVTGFRNPLRSSGEFLQWRGHGLIWNTRKPFAASLVLNAKSLRAQQGKASYALDASKEPAIAVTNTLLFALLSGDTHALAQRFTIVDVANNLDEWRLQLTPREPGLSRMFSQITLAGARYVSQVELLEANGNRTEILFKAQAQTPAASVAERKLLD